MTKSAALFALLLAQQVAADLPPPLPLVCLATQQLGCYNDSWTRTFPVQLTNQTLQDRGTLETCAFQCATATPAYPLAAIETGGQCFCTDAAGLAKAQANRTLDAECNTPCNGFPLTTCGGEWKVQAYNFSCQPYVPGSAPWQNASLPVAARVDDLVSRLTPLQLMGQLLQNGVDVYAPGVQLPRYIVSQE